MPELNKFLGIGRLGTDPELRYTPSGTAVCSLRMCFTDRWKDKDGNKMEKACWIDAVVFGKGAEVVKQYIVKGRELFVEGRLEQDEWTDKQGNKRSTIKINVQNFQFVGGNAKAKDAQVQDHGDDGMKRGKAAARREEPAQQEDDLPFSWLVLVPLLGLGASVVGAMA